MTELQALQNAISNLPGIDIYERPFEDKRRTTKKYYLCFNGATISPVLNYDNMNHFILGFSRAKQILINQP